MGGVRPRGGAAPHREPRAVQVTALPRRGIVREGGGLARARPPRRPPPADAVDGRRVPRRRGRDRGLPPLNGFASEWTTLQVAPPGAGLRRRRGRDRGRGRAGGAGGDGGARGALLRQGRRPGAARAAARREAVAHGARRRPGAMRAGSSRSPAAACCSGWRRAFSSARSSGSRRGRATADDGRARPAGDGLFRSGGIALALAALTGALALLRGGAVAAPAPTWACGQLVERQLDWTSAGFTKPLRLVLEDVLRPEREIVVRAEGGVVRRRSPTRAASRTSSRNASTGR